jgi:hypothetical protein
MTETLAVRESGIGPLADLTIAAANVGYEVESRCGAVAVG